MTVWFRVLAASAVLAGGMLLARPPSRADGAATPDGARPDTLGEIPADRWLNVDGEAPNGADLRGAVVLVEFWTYLCSNCKHVEPWVHRVRDAYGEGGLTVLGVHSPEFPVERDVVNVQEYLETNAIGWPIAIDNGFRVWRRYNTTNAWPALLVFDRRGALVYRRAGEGAVRGAEEAIRRSLAEAPPTPVIGREENGVRITAVAARVTADSAVLTVSLMPQPGTRLVRRPGNELEVMGGPGVHGPTGGVVIGEEADSTTAEVDYFAGAASVRVALRVKGPGPFPVRGRLIYRTCDTVAGTCRRSVAGVEALVPIRSRP